MTRHGRATFWAVLAGLAMGAVLTSLTWGQVAAPEAPPKDLRPLLSPRYSEMRLVVAHYTGDRTLLATNYAGRSDGGRGGRGAAPAPVISTRRIARLKRFDLSWQAVLARIDSAKLSPEARADLVALNETIRKNLVELDTQVASLGQIQPLIPFAPDLVGLIEDRIAVKDMDWEKTAGLLTVVTRRIKDLQTQLSDPSGGALRPNAAEATNAAQAVDLIRTNLTEWNTFYNGYDPLFTWWMALPCKATDTALQAYATLLRGPVAGRNQASNLKPSPFRIDPAPPPAFSETPNIEAILALHQDEMAGVLQLYLGNRGGQGGRGGGANRSAQFFRDWLAALKTLEFEKLSRNAQVDYLFVRSRAELEIDRMGKPLPANPPRKTDASGIRGNARGREGLVRDLEDEGIPYTPEQLLVLAEREFAWCEQEMRRASRDMGYGDDWKQALEKTKTMHPPPGGQPAMIRDLLLEAVDYVRAHDMVTVPEVDAESQHMIMMTPERQIVNPFFTGGTQISVSFPTNTMEFDAREQSMRGNNRPWSHATAFHEMIPGHNLVAYVNQRYNGYRPSLGNTPFFGEGWAVYWELILYDKGFHATPEDRVGALFWRMHRCARILFSLRFHMGQWSPQEAVDFLVDRVGHERDNAIAEVRRSFQGDYGPLYQAAYLLGALQLRGLRHELVDRKDTKVMTEKSFHDEILRGGAMPITWIRLTLTRDNLTPDMPLEWKFYGDLPDR